MANQRYGSNEYESRGYGRGERSDEREDYDENYRYGEDWRRREPRSFATRGAWSGGDPYGDYGQDYEGDRDRSQRYRPGGEREFGRTQRGAGETGPIYQNQYGLNRGVDWEHNYGEGQGGFGSYGRSFGYGEGVGQSGGGRTYGRSQSGALGQDNPMLADQAAGRTGPHRGRGPKNYTRSDDRIREDVSDHLSDHSHLDASEIEVEVRNGEVTLNGTVDDRASKRLAEDCAEEVSGVKHVQNNLRVRATAQTATTTGTGAAAASSSKSRT